VQKDPCEWRPSSDERDQKAHQAGERETVQEDEAENDAFAAVLICGRCGDNDALRRDHFAHDASGGVGGGHQIGRDAKLLGRKFLQAAEEHVRGGI